MPPFVTLCIEGRYPFEAESLLSLPTNVVLKFATSDTGFLCPAPDSTAKKALLAAKLGERMTIHGTFRERDGEMRDGTCRHDDVRLVHRV